MTNSPQQQQEITTRLHRLSGLTDNQIATLSQSLDYASVESWSDSVLAAAASGTLPSLPLNPSGGLPLGLPGAVQSSRWVGATTSGAPSSGTFAARDWVVAGDGHIWICTAGGTPGTWVDAGSGGGGGSYSLPDATSTVKGGVQLTGDLGGTAASPTVPGLASKVNAAGAAAAAPVQTVAGRTGAVTLAKGDVGLGNVDNTSDASKPVSTAQAAADALRPTDLTDRFNDTTETVPAGATTNCAVAGVTKTAPALAGSVGTPPLRWAVRNASTGTITMSYPYTDGTATSLTMLPGEVLTFRQKTTLGWAAESGNKPLSSLDARYNPLVPAHSVTPVLEGLNLKIWGHSYTVSTGLRCTPGAEWHNRLKYRTSLIPTTYGIASSRLIDNYWDMVNGTDPAGLSVAGAKLNPAPSTYHGVVYALESQINDILNPLSAGGTAPATLTATRQQNYQDTMRACLSVMRATSRGEDGSATKTGTGWSVVTDSRFSNGSYSQTTNNGDTIDFAVTSTVANQVVYVHGVLSSASTPGTVTVILDPAGANTDLGAPESTAWESIRSNRNTGYDHTLGPWVKKVTLATAGAHTIRVKKTDATTNPVGVDFVALQHPAPMPVLVLKDPQLTGQSTAYQTAKATFDTLVAFALADFPSDIKLIDLAPVVPYISPLDNLHPNDQGMNVIANTIGDYLATLTFTGSQSYP